MIGEVLSAGALVVLVVAFFKDDSELAQIIKRTISR